MVHLRCVRPDHVHVPDVPQWACPTVGVVTTTASRESAATRPFTLSTFVREFIESSAEADPSVLAVQIAAKLTPKQRELALQVTLPDYVRSVVGRSSAASRKPETERKTLTTPQRINLWWANFLASRLFNGSEWRLMGESTAEDLRGAAGERYETAARTTHEADQLVKLAALLEESGRDTVADLDEGSVRETLGGAS